MIHRVISFCVFVSIAGLVSGCDPSDEPQANEVYAAVLTELSRELELERPVLLHPFLGKLDHQPGEAAYMSEFLTYDSARIQNLVKADPQSYQPCRTSPTGGCIATDGKPWLVLSELFAPDPNSRAVIVLVRDQPPQRTALTSFIARIRYGTRYGPMSVQLSRLP